MFLWETTSTACFFGSGLKYIFHWQTHSDILTKSLFILLLQRVGSSIVDNSDVSSAKILTTDLSPLGRSLMKMRKSNSPSIDPWGTPAKIDFQSDIWPFSTTLWSLSDKESLINIRSWPRVPKVLSFNKRPACQTCQRP